MARKRYLVDAGGLQQKVFDKKTDARNYAKELSLTRPYNILQVKLTDLYKESSNVNLSKYEGYPYEKFKQGKRIE